MFDPVAVASGGVPWFGAGPLADRPEPGEPGRLYLAVEPNDIFFSRDTGVSWRDVRGGETAAQILAKLLTADADDSGLNATTLTGLPPGAFAPTAHRHDNATTTTDGFISAADKARAHDRLHGVASQDHSDIKNAPQDTQVLVFRLAGPQGMGFYWESPGAATVPSADETQEGKSRQATAQQIIDGAAGNLFATVARLKEEQDRRDRLGLFRAFLAANKTIAGGSVWARVDGYTQEFDVGDGIGSPPAGWFDPVTGRYAPGRTGHIEIEAAVRLGALGSGSRLEAQVRKNGADLIALPGPVHSSAGTPIGTGGSVRVRADQATDFFEVFVRHSGAGAQDLVAGLMGTWISGRYLGPL